MHPNQALFETIKKQALAYHNTPSLTPETSENILKKAKEAITDNDFLAAEWHLTRHRDAQRGFISDLYWITDIDLKNNKQRIPVYRTDQRHANAAAEKDTFQTWAIMGLAYYRTAIAMLNTSEEKHAMKQEAKIFLDRISAIEDQDAAKKFLSIAIEKELAPKLAGILGSPPSEIIKILKKFKDFTNMGVHPSLVHETWTRHTGQDNAQQDCLVIDLPLSKLTGKQRTEFQAIQDNENNKPLWFTAQPKATQLWIQRATSRILDGKMIPTQMLQYIPSLRRGEATLGLVVSINEQGQSVAQEFYQGCSFGNLGFQIKRFNNQQQCLELIKENFRQVQVNTGATTIVINSLLTTHRWRSRVFALLGKQREDTLYALLKQAATEFNQEEKNGPQVIVGNTPINSWRTVEACDLTAIAWVRQQVDKYLKEYKENSGDLLMQRLKQAREDDAKLTPSLDQKKGDPENANMRLAASSKNMVSLLRAIDAQNNPNAAPSIVMLDPCKSEKDRGGVVKLATMAYAALYNFGGSFKEHAHEFAYRIRAKTGGQGGSAGVNHVKDNEGITPKTDDFPCLRGETAKYNNQLPKKKNSFTIFSFFSTKKTDSALSENKAPEDENPRNSH